MKMKLHRSLPYIIIRDDVSTTVLDEFDDVNRFKWELLQRRRSEKEEEDVDQPPVKVQRLSGGSGTYEYFDGLEESDSDISDSENDDSICEDDNIFGIYTYSESE
ncbi:hypothetical protein PCE1_000443 [Barthelona sp. PCE]